MNLENAKSVGDFTEQTFHAETNTQTHISVIFIQGFTRRDNMKIPTIKFSHHYLKMPPRMFLDFAGKTILTGMEHTHKNRLTKEFILDDTAYKNKDGTTSYYELPDTELLILKLRTEGLDYVHEWQTVRSYNKEKAVYYAGLIGKEVKIHITGE